MVVTAKVPKRVRSAAPDAVSRESPGKDEYLYLTGRPRLRTLIKFVKAHAVAPAPEATLTDVWHTAHRVVQRLETEEAGIADDPRPERLGPEYEPLLLEFFKDPLVRNGFNTVPTEVAMVELDRLVVYQKHIDLTFVRQLERELGPAPTEEQVFRTCLLHDHSQPPAKWARVRQDAFVFMSPSNDLRFLGVQPLERGHLTADPPHGRPVGIVGITVGFGSNFLNAVCAERRVILNNGSHRAYTLRKLGVTHVPCVIQHASSREEVDLVAAQEVRRDPDLCLKHPRPPMLKDYFNPELHMVFPAFRRLRHVMVRFQVEEYSEPTF
jgi:hypothetical protein